MQKYTPNSWVVEQGQVTLPSKGLRGLNWRGKVGFRLELVFHKIILTKFLFNAKNTGECFIGPFYGEFGNFLLHFLPFISYLNRRKIKCTICVLDKYVPFLRDHSKQLLYNNIYILNSKLLDKNTTASANTLNNFPAEFELKISLFKKAAVASRTPLLDLSQSNLYWYSFRNWQLRSKQYFYNLSESNIKSNKVVIFPRRKGAQYTANNGEELDYRIIANILSAYFQEVVLIGDPSMSDTTNIESNERIIIKTGNNDTVIKECSEARLIVSQHSGAIHVGLYTSTPCLIIFKGNLPIKGLDDTIRFRVNKLDCPLYLINRVEEQLEQFCIDFNKYYS
jgi:hypothetical protein